MRRLWLLVVTLVIPSACGPADEAAPTTDVSELPAAGLALSPTEGEGDLKRVVGFEPGRAILSDVWGFDPFPVTKMEPLKDAFEDGKVGEDTAVLLLMRGDTRLVLLTEQMSYHHVAQGELEGEPWMVTF
jgi:hypothetical protein